MWIYVGNTGSSCEPNVSMIKGYVSRKLKPRNSLIEIEALKSPAADNCQFCYATSDEYQLHDIELN